MITLTNNYDAEPVSWGKNEGRQIVQKMAGGQARVWECPSLRRLAVGKILLYHRHQYGPFPIAVVRS